MEARVEHLQQLLKHFRRFIIVSCEDLLNQLFKLWEIVRDELFQWEPVLIVQPLIHFG